MNNTAQENEKVKTKRTNIFKDAMNGLDYVFKNESNAQLHLIATMIVITAGALLNINAIEWLVLTACIAAVIMAEIFNTAIEQLVNLVHPQFGEKAGLVKDISAGAVLATAIAAVVIGCIIFIPKIVALCI